MKRRAHVLALALCVGLAAANLARTSWIGPLLFAGALVGGALAASGLSQVLALAAALALGGWWWGSARLDTLDRSPLRSLIGTAERARIVVTGPARVGRYDLRIPATVVRYGDLRPSEPALAKLPKGRAPPQGAVLDVIAQVTPPRGPDRGFDERTWLRRRGVHVVLRVDGWRLVGRRGGIGGIADRLRRRLDASVALRLEGERAALLRGVVLGDDAGLSEQLKDRFRASGLYHLLAVSGQNVALVAGGALALAWLLGAPRVAGELGALAAMVAYVLAVGAQPSVVRAGVAGALGSLAWLTARAAERWYLLLVGAIVLLAWNPYTLLDPGFQLSFAAVGAIFVLVPRLQRALDGYPMPDFLRPVVAVSAACGLATAPIAWLQFHAIPLLSVPANALAAPAVVPLLGLALVAAAVAPLSTGAAAAVAWLNGWCAAYLAGCARLVGGLPGAQVRSTRGLLVLLGCVLLAAAYAWPRWRPRPTSSPST